MTDRAADPPRLSAAVAKDIQWSTRAGRIVIAAAGLASTSWAYRNMVVTAIDGGAEPIFAWVAAGFLELGLLGSAFMARAAILSDKDSRFWMTLMWVLSGASGAFSGSHELGNPSWWMPALAAGLPLAAAALWHGLIVGEHRMNAGPDIAEQLREKLTLRYDIAQDALRDALRASRGHRAEGHALRAWWYQLPVSRLRRAEHRARVKAFHAHRNIEHFDERLAAHLEADERADAYRARRFALGFLPSTEPSTAHLDARLTVRLDEVGPELDSAAQGLTDGATARELETVRQIERGSAADPAQAADVDHDAQHAVEQQDQPAERDAARAVAQNPVPAPAARPVEDLRDASPLRAVAQPSTARAVTDDRAAAQPIAQPRPARVEQPEQGAREVAAARSRSEDRPRTTRPLGKTIHDLTDDDMFTILQMRNQTPPASWPAIGKEVGCSKDVAARAFKNMQEGAPATPALGTPTTAEQATMDELDFPTAYVAAAPGTTQRNDY
uniref:hypothetical protein n=1 Tax=Promicromonospora sp. CA-289581 TaxID=3240013 RepID=UPI003F4989A9